VFASLSTKDQNKAGLVHTPGHLSACTENQLNPEVAHPSNLHVPKYREVSEP